MSINCPTCPYCGQLSRFLPSSEAIYGAGRDFGPAYYCEPCQAWVGAHRESLEPLGRLANKELRVLKIRTHAAFDPLWRDLAAAYPEANGVYAGAQRRAARSRAYRWLAEQLHIKVEDCHVGAFDPELCRRAMAVIARELPDSGTIRTWAKSLEALT